MISSVAPSKNPKHPARSHKYAAICLGGVILGLVVAKSTWLGWPLAAAFAVAAVWLVARGATSR